jgi:lysozyme family protein
MANFSIAYKKTSIIEGSYSYDKDDNGGETYKGIARIHNPNWEGWNVIDSLKSNKFFPQCLNNNEELNQKVYTFFRNNYWDKIKGDGIEDQNIADELYEIAVNMGIRESILKLQKTLNILNRNENDYYNIDEDGVFGKITLNTLNYHPKNYKYIYNMLNILQACHYINIVKRTESQERFIRGWLKRVNIIT